MPTTLEQLAAELFGESAQKQIAAENPYYMIAEAPTSFASILSKAQAPTQDDLWTNAAAASLAGLLGGALQGYGNTYQNKLTNRYNTALIQAIGGRVPQVEGLSPGLFGAAQRGGLLFNAVKEAQAEDIAREVNLKKQLVQAEKPWLIQDGGAATPVTEPVAATNPLVSALKTQPMTMEEKRRARYQGNMQSGMDPTSARMSARDDTAAELKSNIGSVDKASKAREYADGLLELADRAQRGLVNAKGSAGEEGVGPGDTFRGAKLWTQSFVDSEAKGRLSGRQELDSIKADLVKMKRSPGAVSDYENRMILAGGPTTDKTSEANQAIIDGWKELALYNQDYADFLETYREINGTSAGADALWTQYRKAYPLYEDTISDKGSGGKINFGRPDWRDFFINLQSGGSSSSAPTSNDLPAQVAALKAQGLSKEEVIKRLAGKYGNPRRD